LDDVAVLVERRTVKFVDRLIDSNSYRKNHDKLSYQTETRYAS